MAQIWFVVSWKWNPEKLLSVFIKKRNLKQCYITVNQDFPEVAAERAACSRPVLCQPKDRVTVVSPV